MNLFDKSIQAAFPRWAYRRAQYRQALAAYEAAKPSRLRKTGADNASGDAVVGKAGAALRGYARQLEQNYDVAKGVLDVLVNNTVGASGISWEPQPRTKSGEIHTEFAKILTDLSADYELHPEVTGEHDYVAAERLACRTWFRDGELLVQMLEGHISSLDHGTRVPFSFELIEADLLPFTLDDEKNGITQGVERNAWGKPRGYHIYKKHPGGNSYTYHMDTKRVSADRMIHPKIVARIKQARGVSVFASVLRRLEDLKDYEESERIAARVAAALTGFIKKGQSEDYTAPDDGGANRLFKMNPGMVFDGLKEGEDVGTIDSNRPSGLLTPFHDAMMRFVAAGTGTGASSISRNYNGTYSAQRQELVETRVNYEVLTALWVSQFTRPIKHRFIDMCIASGLAKVPRNLDMHTLYDADYRGPAMPWIDPEKEAKANKMLERCGYKSAPQVIRERNGNPRTVMDQIHEWREKANQLGLVFESDPAHDKKPDESPSTEGFSTSSDEEKDNVKKD